MPPPFALTKTEANALERIFACATHVSSSGRAARSLIMAWAHPEEFGGLVLTDLWVFDAANEQAASTVLALACRARGLRPQLFAADYARRIGELAMLHRKQLAHEKSRDGA